MYCERQVDILASLLFCPPTEHVAPPECNAAMVRTTGFESFSMFILVCWSIINSIVNDDILNLRLLWLGSGARHSLCVAHFSSYTLTFWLDQQNCFK